ncbi:MAG TPA: alpha/beta hydrolase [Humisphaera sp.]
MAWAAVAARRRRSWTPLRSIALSCVSAAVVATALCLSNARAVDARAPLGQIALAAYLLLGVLSLLKGLDHLLKRGTARLLAVRLPDGSARPDRRQRWLRGGAAGLLRVGVLFGVALPYVMSLCMVYRPKVVPNDDPRTLLGAAFEPVAFEATDGSRVAAWWLPARPPPRGKPVPPGWGERTVVVCHGLGANKANHLPLGRDLWACGYNLLAIDFRAHGESGGQLTSFGDAERHDVLGAVRWAKANRPAAARKVYGLGISMGAAALLAASGEPTPEGRAIDAVAVLSTYGEFESLADHVAATKFPRPLGWAVRHLGVPVASAHVGRDLTAFRPIDAAAKLAPRPLFVAHGRGDAMIPFASGERLFAAAGEPKTARWVGEWDGSGYVIRTETGTGTPTGPPADHDHLVDDDATLVAVRTFFEAAR